VKALILAAGSGKRMGKYSADLPKGMLNFNGKPLIAWQLEKYRSAGIKEIAIATGYKAELINFEGVKYFHNPRFQTTNMVETLMCCREYLDEDIIISYSDILFTPKLLDLAKTFNGEIGVSVDEDWKKYWILRYDTTEHDLESLDVNSDGKIRGIGKPVSDSDGLNYRYIGFNIFSRSGINAVISLYDEKKLQMSNWEQSGNSFNQGYMTDLMHELIKSGNSIDALVSKGGWLEFDTEKDYEVLLGALQSGKLDKELF
jgi:choline kinase